MNITGTRSLVYHFGYQGILWLYAVDRNLLFGILVFVTFSVILQLSLASCKWWRKTDYPAKRNLLYFLLMSELNGIYLLYLYGDKYLILRSFLLCIPVGRVRQIQGDSSLMTYRGHSVLHTLIRAYFSPEYSTGQRYIYSGCATGCVVGK